MKTNPMTTCDFYKLGHMTMDVPGVQRVVSTWTPRHHKHDKDNEFTVNFGHQYVVKRWFDEYFQDFFAGDFDKYAEDFRRKVDKTFNETYVQPVINAFRKLHELGYLPMEVWAVPEGYLIPDGCPSVMMFNTVEGFGWLPQFLEDLWSMHSWLPSTSATTAYYRRLNATPFFEENSDDPSAVRRLCGDFSMRGMTGHEAAAISGAAHLLSFDRTATIDANSILEEYYGADLTENPPGYGLPSLEHSVVEKGVAYFREQIINGTLIQNEKYARYVTDAVVNNWEINLIAEMCFLIYMLTEVQPSGNFTYVSDTYDFWGIVGKVLPELYFIIIDRQGKLIIRPDSGDPIKVILGNPNATDEVEKDGALKALENIFGYKTNKKGKKLLHPAIGLIYGDAITAERQQIILEGLKEREYSPEAITLGIGAYTYQYVTRDTRGFAIKATACVFDNIGEVPIFKLPKTDDSKKSQRGAVLVVEPTGYPDVPLQYNDRERLEWATGYHDQLMRPIFKDGKTMNQETIYTIRERLWKGAF